MDRRDFIRMAAGGFAGLSIADQLAGKRLLAQGQVLKVTAPEKLVTDAFVINYFKNHGMAEQSVLDYVEFAEDYKAQRGHYNAKIYHNRLTDERIVVCGIRSRVTPDGSKIVAGFERGNGRWYISNNLMTGEVSDNGRRVIAPVVDQPDGRRVGQETSWNPVLNVGGTDIVPISGPALKDDLIAPGYATNNCLEWDYGYCKCVVRVIQEFVQERWIFHSNPGKEVLITHNTQGPWLKLGRYNIGSDRELVTVARFGQVDEWPFMVDASATFKSNDNANAEDAFILHDVAAGVSWATLIAAAGNTIDDSGETHMGYVQSDVVSNNWEKTNRPIFCFDTAALSGETVSAATFSIRGQTLTADPFSGDLALGVYEPSPGNPAVLAAGDYNSFNATALSDTAIDFNSAWLTGAYNDFPLNASGIAAINTAGGITNLGCREKNYDVAATAPTWVSFAFARCRGYYSWQGTNEPKLVVTFGAVGPASVAGIASPASVAGVANPSKIAGIE